MRDRNLSLHFRSVAVFPAAAIRRPIRFNIINRKTGHRVQNQIVDAETGREVAGADRARGFTTRGDSVLIEQNEFDEAALDALRGSVRAQQRPPGGQGVRAMAFRRRQLTTAS
jgi:non-homologous end joining protein Ku